MSETEKPERRKVTALRVAIAASGYTSQHIAETVGVEPSTLSKWSAGDRTPRADHAVRLASVLGTTVDALWPTEAAAA